MCPNLAKIWTLLLGASQFTIYMGCFTRGIIIQRLEFSQLSPKFPEKRGVVAILCSELSVTRDQWEVTIQPYGQSEEATALHDWLNSSVEWYALEAKPGNAFSRALSLSLENLLGDLDLLSSSIHYTVCCYNKSRNYPCPTSCRSKLWSS